MKIGFGKVDITPRLGVPLSGFGAFRNRVSTSVRDRLWVRAMAVEAGDRRVVIVGCDLLAISLEDTERVRDLVRQAAGLSPEALLISCSHTHSGPDACPSLIGWGGYDPPYMQLLPRRIAQAAVEALESLTPATLYYAESPCEGIAFNREYDPPRPTLEEAMDEAWRPAKPEKTHTTCHVLRADDLEGRTIGFLSHFGCHPVVCSENNHQFHGDYPGVATNLIERDYPGSVGLFLQGTEGDINSCVAHQSEEDSLRALDQIAARYASAVRTGLAAAEPIEVEAVAAVLDEAPLARKPWTVEDVQTLLEKEEAMINDPQADDAEGTYRAATVRAMGLRRIRDILKNGPLSYPPTPIQGVRLGPIALLAAPFEIFRQIQLDVQADAKAPIPLVLSVCNDFQGYALDKTCFERGGYAADMVPLMLGFVPYARLYEELPAALLTIDRKLEALVQRQD